MHLGLSILATALFAYPTGAHSDGTAPQSRLDRAGQIVLSLPRLLPLVALNTSSVQAPGPIDAPNGTTIVTGNHPSGLDVYELPRLGIDWLASSRLSLGLELAAYATPGGHASLGDTPFVSVLGVAPRVGYLAPLAGGAFFWLRAGVAYYVLGQSGVDGTAAAPVPWSFTWRQLDVDVETHLVVVALPPLAVTTGIVAELPVSGAFSEQRSGAAASAGGASWLHIGFVGGLLTYL